MIGGLGHYARGMARTHDGLMTPLTIGRNRVLSLVVFFLRCISVHCDVSFVFCNAYFQCVLCCCSLDGLVFFILCCSCTLVFIPRAFVDPVLPGVEVLCSFFGHFFFWECFRISMGNIL